MSVLFAVWILFSVLLKDYDILPESRQWNLLSFSFAAEWVVS